MVDEQKKSAATAWSALNLAWELGYTIAIPIVIFAIIGRLLDKKFDTSPWFILAAIFVSLMISGVGVFRKASAIMAETNQAASPPVKDSEEPKV